MALPAEAALVAGLLLGVPPASGAFPGGNGKIAFVADWDGDFEIY